MGVTFSNEDLTQNDFLEKVDTYVANLILSMDFEAIHQLNNPAYCKEMLKLSQQIFLNNFHGFELQELYQRGSETENILERKELCNEVAKFYLTVANVYAAIFNVLKPMIENPNKQTEMCEQLLKSEANYMNELEHLYLDKYNIETGQFDGLTEKGKLSYRTDLQSFYGGFSGSTQLPSHINKFSDISLMEINQKPNSRSKNVFEEYGAHVQKMVQSALKKQECLKQILDELFSTKDDQVRIHPNLTKVSLHRILLKTRKCIVELYSQCQRDQEKTNGILKQIAGDKMRETLNNQIEALHEDMKGLV